MTLSGSKKLIFSVCAVLLFFGLLEGSLRLFYKPHRPFRFYAPHPKSAVMRDPDLGYRLRPNFNGSAYASSVRTNSLGLRGPEFDPKTKKGFRIVALGDSCTFGFGATDNDHTYPAQLADRFKEANRDAQVINAGVVGYTSLQALKFLQKDILAFRPDALLIYVGWNDLGNSLLPDWTPTMTQDVESTNIWLPSPPYFVLALSDFLSRFRPRHSISFRTEALDSYVTNVNDIVDAARRNGVDPMLVSWPTRVAKNIETLRKTEIMPGTGFTFGSWFEYYQRAQRELQQIAARKNVRLISLAEQLNQKDSTYYFDEIHLSDRGNAEAALVIFESIRDVIPRGGANN